MMTKILNLDELEGPSDKLLKFKGVDHVFHPLTVGEFIAQAKRAEAKDAAGDTKVSESVEYMVELIVRAFPTVKTEDLQGLPLERLRVITDFVNDVVSTEAAVGSPEGEEAKKGKGKSK
jgi:hypothetical protein